MPKIVHEVLHYRINIDQEYQGWVLVFATMTAGFFFCLPCYCAGLSSPLARRLAAWLSQRLPVFYAIMFFFNASWLALVVTWMPDWTVKDYVLVLAKGAAWGVSHMLKFMTSIVMIVVFIVVVAFKDRILLLLGLDHRTLFKCKFRDLICCGGGNGARFRAIELTIWKVEDLPSADLFTANNVYMEVFMGYNESMKTRVHNNAGNSCTIKETIQLNYDPEDDDDNLHIFVKNQKVMGAGDLGRLEIAAQKLKEIVADGDSKKRAENNGPVQWSDSNFTESRLNPRGNIFFRITTVTDEGDDYRTC